MMSRQEVENADCETDIFDQMRERRGFGVALPWLQSVDSPTDAHSCTNFPCKPEVHR